MNKKIRALSSMSPKRVKIFLLSLSVLFLAFFLIKNAKTCTIGFISGYTAAYGLLEGEDVKTYYNNDEFAQLVSQICGDTYDIYSPNPPTYAFMMVPLVAFNYPTAKVLWIIINLLMIGLIVKLVKANLRQVGVLEILLSIALFQPVYANLRFGQNYIFILLMITLIWVGWKNEKTGLMVIGLVLMTSFKLGLVWVWPLLLLNGKWKPVMIAGGVLIVVFAASIPVVGIEAWSVFLDELSAVSDKESGSVTAFQSIPGFFRHLFTSHPVWNPSPVWDQPFLGGIFYKLCVLALVVFSLFMSRIAHSKNLKVAVIVIVSVITSPFTLDYHYPVLILAFLMVYDMLTERREKLFLLLAYVAIALPLPYTSKLFTEGYLSLLAYPKLYGAVLLMMICFSKMWKERKATTQLV